MPKRFYSPFERLAYEIDPDTGCWNWTKHVSKHNGYGYLTVDKVIRTAHTYSYELHRGPIPPGKWIDHLCRNRKCVNPDHMELVSPGENCRRGIRTKINHDDAVDIRFLYGSIPTAAIATRYGISIGHVRNIAKGIRWGNYGERKKADTEARLRREARESAGLLPEQEVAQTPD